MIVETWKNGVAIRMSRDCEETEIQEILRHPVPPGGGRDVENPRFRRSPDRQVQPVEYREVEC